MKKLYVIGLCILNMMIGNSIAHAEDELDSSLFKQVLSTTYGAETDVSFSPKSCRATYPGVQIEEKVYQYIEPQKPDEQSRIETSIKTTKIAETKAECVREGDFNGKPQYKISHNSPNKIIAQLYNQSQMAFVKDFDIKNIHEELFVVPEFGFISSGKLNIRDVSYTEKDETTGLKSELGNLKELNFTQQLSKNDDKVKYSTNMLIDNFNVSLPIFSLHLKSSRQAADMEYKISDEKHFDYAEIWRNIQDLTSAKSRAVGSGRFEIGFLDFGVSFDLDFKTHIFPDSAGNFTSSGSMSLDNVVISGENIPATQRFKKFFFKYSLSDMPGKSFTELLKSYQQKELSDTKPDREVLAKVLDEIAKTAVLAVNGEIRFPQAGIEEKLNLSVKNGYLHGTNKITVKNLYNIFPEQKQCVNNPAADEIPACSSNILYNELATMIDISKNNSETTLIYNEQGLFRGNEKIGEPVEVNFLKRLQEQEAKEAEMNARLQEALSENETK